MVFGSGVIKPDLNRARLVKKKERETMRERANKQRCKGMLNEAVPKSTAVGQKECRSEGGVGGVALKARLPVCMGTFPKG